MRQTCNSDIMLRIFKKVVWLIMILAAVRVSAFTVWGPKEAWQTADMSYGVRYAYQYTLFPNLPVSSWATLMTELGGSKNFGEGSRLNVPIITYAYDYTFLSYFGVEGMKAVD